MDIEVKVKSLKKALDILDCFTLERPELGITELSTLLSLNKSNVHNIVSTFEACGYLEQNPESEKYRLSLKILQLAHIASRNMSFQSIVHKAVNELAETFDEIVYFGIPDGENVMYMDGGFPEKVYNVRWVQGMTAPLVCTSIGKAILAYMPEEFICRVLEKPLEKFTEYTITDPEKIHAQLKHIKECGYSEDRMEHEYGIKCVGVPVFNNYGKLIGALSTTGPSLRFTDENMSAYVAALKKKAAEIRNVI